MDSVRMFSSLLTIDVVTSKGQNVCYALPSFPALASPLFLALSKQLLTIDMVASKV
jgi:hypothetical protein